MEYARVLIIDVFLLKLLILRLHNPLHVTDIYLFKCCSYKRELSSTVSLRRTHAGQQIMTSLKLTSPSPKQSNFGTTIMHNTALGIQIFCHTLHVAIRLSRVSFRSLSAAVTLRCRGTMSLNSGTFQ